MPAPSPSSSFRLDINGLRAWAVVAVVLYHFGVPGFAGGFVGVDIFFVISGFLMSGIIVGKLEQGSFSLIDFYMARAKRLVPALAVLCLTLILLGWFFLLPSDYKQLATHVAYSLAFVSNVEYWQTTGYFDVAAHEKWLLHTWSLSVEWQFYLLLPIVLWAAWRMKPGRAMQLWVVSVGMAMSLLACVITTQSAADSAFFLLHYRAWEMLAGGLVFLLVGKVPLSSLWRRALAMTGILLIVAANFVFDKSSVWPGAGAALPVIATMLVLMANHDGVLTGHRVAQWLGDRSYSIYLWHWPVYVGLVYVELRSDTFALTAGLIATVVLGHASYSWVEDLSRNWFREKRFVQAVSTLGLGVLSIALLAVVIWKTQGVDGRFDASVELMAAETENVNPRRAECHTRGGTTSPLCSHGPGVQKLIVLGDSHADALVTGVAMALAADGIEVVQSSYSACPFVLGLRLSPTILARQSPEYRCSDFIKAMSDELVAKYPSTPVLIINRYAVQAFGPNEMYDDDRKPRVYFSRLHTEANQEFLDEFSRAITQTACELAKSRDVYVMRPVPEMGVDVPKMLSRRMSFGATGEPSISMAEYQRRNGWVWAAQDAAHQACGVRILDPLPYLCKDGRCFGTKDGRALYSDDDHLSEYGNRLFVPMYRDAFKDWYAPRQRSDM